MILIKDCDFLGEVFEDMRKLKNIVKSAVFMLSAAALVACGAAKDESKPADQGGAPQAESQVITVGTEANFPPFEKQEGGEIVGFDIDIIKAIGAESGFDVDVQHMGWDLMLDGVDKGKVDTGVAAITIDEKRQQIYDFSDPYFEAKQIILVKNDSTVASLDDLTGKKIAVQAGTTGDSLVRDKFGQTYEGVKGYEDIPAAVDDLLNGRVDAVVADDFVIKEFVKQIGDKGFKAVEDPSIQNEYYGIIVKKGNQELLTKINDGLNNIKEKGKYDEIYTKYFPE